MEGHGNFFVRVFYNFTASNPDELSGFEGDIVKVKSQVNEHWYEGEINGKKGLFPVIYTTKIDDSLQYDVFVAKETYNGIRPSELSFLKGERINVIEKVDENWWRGESRGKIGIFPNSYVGNENLYDSICGDDHMSYQNGGIYGNQEMFSVRALYDFEARNHEELSFPQGGIIIITKDIDVDWYEGSFEGKSGLFPKSYVEHCSQDIYEVPPRACATSIYPFVGESDSELTFKEGEVIFLRKRAGSQWLEGELDGNVGLFPASFVDVEIDLPPEEQNAGQTNNDHAKTVQPQKILWRQGNRARALYHFSALHTGDLALNEGDVVTVVQVVDDNWIEGKLDSGVSGMCPSAYLELADFTPNGHVQAGESLGYKDIRRGFAAQTNQPAHITSSSITATQAGNGGKRHSQTEINFSKYSGPNKSRATRVTSVGDDRLLKASNKPKPAPRPPQTKSQTLGAESRTSTRNLSRSYSSQSSPSQQQTNKAFYAIPFKSSHNKFTPVSFNPSKSKSSVAYTQKSSIANYGFDSQDGGQSIRKGSEGCSGDSLLDMSVSNRASSLNLAAPLVALPSNSTQSESGSKELPIVPKRKAPLPPKRTAANDYKSYSLPRTRANQPNNTTNMDKFSSERTQFGSSPNIAQPNFKDSVGLRPTPRVETAHKKRPPPPPTRTNKDRPSNITRSATISSARLANYKQEKEKESENKKARPASVYYVGEDDDKFYKSNSLEDIRAAGKSGMVSSQFGSNVDQEDSAQDQDSIDYNSPNIVQIPGVAELNKKIANAEHNQQVEWRACSGMKTILQMLVHDQDKYKEMEVKITRSQQKIAEWKDIIDGLKGERTFLIKSYQKRKTLEDNISLLESDLQKQARSRKSLETLLEVVEDSRREEVLENLSVCDGIIDDLNTSIKELEDSLQGLDQSKPNPSTQKHSAEQRQKVVNELIHTEQDYLRDLQLCLKYFADELKNSKIVEADILFGNMKSVIETSSKLLSRFEQAVRGKDVEQQELGKCFVDLADEIKDVYAQYCRNHDDAISLLEKYEEVPEAQEVFNKCLKAIRDSTKCWDLSSFLIKPVQRVLKYPLLLSELLKYTPEIHKDKQNLIKAIHVMTDVATAINEVKRRKDIVLKYKRVEDSGISNKIQKLNWHSVLKKSSRFNQRITQFTGLVSQTVDKQFNEEEKRFTALEKAVKNLIKNVTAYMEQFQEIGKHQYTNGENIEEYYMEALTCTEVTMYKSTMTRITDVLLASFMTDVQKLVLSPLNILLSKFQGPQRLILKREHKCLDYDSRSNKIEKIRDGDKLKAAKAELQSAKKDYEALNAQLLEDLPLFYDKTVSLVKDCILNFSQAKRTFHAIMLGEYTNLMLMPLVKEEGDIVEHQATQTRKVIEKFADLSIIPSQFLGKEILKKRREAKKHPLIPLLPASTGDMTPEQPEDKTQSRERIGSLSKKRMAPPPPPRSVNASTPIKGQSVDQSKPAPKKQSAPQVPQPLIPVDITPSNFEPYVVVCSFEAQNPGELPLNEGELVTIQRQCDSSGNPEWWLVSCAGVSGYVPSSFLEKYSQYSEEDQACSDSDDEDDDDDDDAVIESQQTTVEPKEKLNYYAQFEFEATSSAELSLDVGQIVSVLQQHDLEGNSEWWLVETEGKKGYVAANFLAPLED
ncbi:dynamin-binding protein-like [Actinia tenebrosa]|uniref:Dynamin-binding protein n=1 Tax=Actinia tenebrosa TaxID=6105 RepID=A0A6P8ICF6_ACTTE|nr:dynamin-binding protein-like [Actinia tenebrosa]